MCLRESYERYDAKYGKKVEPKWSSFKVEHIKNKKIKIHKRNIYLDSLDQYDEIILLGSGKGIASVSGIKNNKWTRKSFKSFKILNNFYQKAVTKCPRYYS